MSRALAIVLGTLTLIGAHVNPALAQSGSWKRVATFDSLRPTHLAVVDSECAYVAGLWFGEWDMEYPFPQRIYRTQDGGNSWTEVKMAPGSQAYFRRLSAPTRNDLFLLWTQTLDKTVHVSTDAGITWRFNAIDHDKKITPRVLQMVTPSFGVRELPFEEVQYTAITRDSARTFTGLPPSQNYFYYVGDRNVISAALLDTQNFVYAPHNPADEGDTTHIPFVITSNGGQTWQLSDPLPERSGSLRLRDVSGVGSEVWATSRLADVGYFYSSDQGKSWATHEVLPGRFFKVSAIGAGAFAALVWTSSVPDSSKNLEFRLSTDNGSEWQVIDSMFFKGHSVIDMRFTDSGAGWALYGDQMTSHVGRFAPILNSVEHSRKAVFGAAAYPNPVTEFLKVKLRPNDVIETVKLIHLNGFTEEVEWESGQGALTVDVRRLPSGMYFLTAHRANDDRPLGARFIKTF